MGILDQSTRPAILSSAKPKIRTGSLLRHRFASSPNQVRRLAWGARQVLAGQRGAQGLAFGGIYLFTLLLYSRAQELFPGLFSVLPIIKITAIATLLFYVASKLNRGELLTVWPIEIRMVLVLVVLSVLL